MNKKIATLGLSLGLAAGGIAGFVLSTPTVSGAVASTETTAPSADGTAVDTDRAAERAARLTEVLQPLVDAGTITQTQLEAVVTALQEAGPIGGGHGGRGGAHLDEVATALGMTDDELRTELQAGNSLAEIAAAEGVEVQTVIDTLIASATERINAKVADGTITQELADARLAEVTERVTAMVNGEMPFGGRGGRGGPGGPGHHGGPFGGDDAADEAGTDSTTDDTPTGS